LKTYLRRPRGHRLDGTLLRDTRKFTKRGDLRSLNLALRKSRKSWWHTSRAMEVSRGAPTRRGCRPWNLRPPIIRKSLFSFKRAAKNPTETGPPLPSDSHTNLSRSLQLPSHFRRGACRPSSFSACHLRLHAAVLFFGSSISALQTAFHSLQRHLQPQKFRSHFFQAALPMARRRKWPGVTENTFLKARVKWLWSWKPTMWQTSATDSCSWVLRSSSACLRRRPVT